MKHKQGEVLVSLDATRRRSHGLRRLSMLANVLCLALLTGVSLAGGGACARQSASQQPPDVSRGSNLCKSEVLPSALQEQLKSEFASWRILEPSDLAPQIAERWNAEKPLRCPSLAVGQFDGTTESSYAVFLVSKTSPKTSYRILIFSRKLSQTSYESQVLDQSDEGGANTQFIRSVEVKAIFDKDSKKKFKVNSPEALLVVFASESEYRAEVYFRTDKRYQREPVDY